ncbi:MAG: hypothetical protein ACREMY_17005 [bacterium]
MNWLVDAIIAFAKRTPYFDLPGYMNRWWVVKPRRWLSFSIRVHQILRSDLDRHIHDHPWSYVTIILRGGYYEVTAISEREFWARAFVGGASFEEGGSYYLRKWYGPGSILFRRAQHAHKLIIPDGTTCWTLFMMGPYSQGWGFYTPEGKVPWREYLPDEAAAVDAAIGKHYTHKGVA